MNTILIVGIAMVFIPFAVMCLYAYQHNWLKELVLFVLIIGGIFSFIIGIFVVADALGFMH